ncbi:glycosyltransferase family 2 protein [Erythrobacter litoralis]|uniref:glycosyltransferase family 2 protein n=1 Tax=Erythrobacter litoralis TaxID=39960 RepID=UPI002434C038|nr:glycosyltransferase family A protein [Erythrobacter litoralis]MDG6080288.1 glycosyltransferase family 2 protein [Erythrobacter litoralis]
MSAPQISVVMPVYNVEAYIEEAIQSVLDQTFENFELIIVDDGGNDNSMAIAAAFSDDRIKIVRQENRGLAGARNTGIANSSAPLVALLDSDDRWHQDKLLLHYVHMRASPDVGVSYSGSQLIDANGVPMRVAMRPKLTGITPRDVLCRNPVGNGSAPVLRREALNAAVSPHPQDPDRLCWFNEDFRQSEDIELWVRLSAVHGVKFEGIEGLLTEYRIIRNALSASVVKQYNTWTQMLAIAKEQAPELIAEHGETARAYQLRYLARRAVQLGDSELAHAFFKRAMDADPKIFMEEPKRTAVTWAAVQAVRLVGQDRFRKLMKPYLKAAA